MGCSCLKGIMTKDDQTINKRIIKKQNTNDFNEFENILCKINGKDLGFLCKIQKQDNNFTYILITNTIVLKEEEITNGKNIKLSLKEKNYNINIDEERKIYIDKDKYNIIIIEIKEIDLLDLKTFIEIDTSSEIKDNKEIYLLNKLNNKINYSKGTMEKINENGYDISFLVNLDSQRTIFSSIIY